MLQRVVLYQEPDRPTCPSALLFLHEMWPDVRGGFEEMVRDFK